jgi:hypothetical protein
MNLLREKQKLMPYGNPMMDGGGGGGGSGGTTVTDLPDWAKGYAQETLGKASALTDINQNPYQTYTKERVAGFQPLQQQAMQTAASPEAFGREVQGYMSPYMQNVVDIQKREAMRGAGILGAQQQARATGAGAFGGYREGIERSERDRNLMTQLGDIQAAGSQRAFEQGTQQARTAQELQMRYGGQQQQIEQQRLSQQYQDFLNQERHPYQQLEFMSNLIRGTPMGTVQTMYNAPPSNMQSLAALGLGAYGVNQLMKKEGGTVSSYARGGSVTSDNFVEGALDRLSNEQLDEAEEIAKADGDLNRLRLIAEERATRASESKGMAGMYNSLPQDVQARMASGGIVAFAAGGEPSAADVINAAMDESSEESSADVINAAMASPGAPDRYGRSLDTLDALITKMSEAKPEQLSQDQLDDIINKRFALEQKLAGPAPYGDIQKFLDEAEAGRPKALQQAKGLAALKAMSAIVQPGGFIRGLAGAGGAAGDVMDKAYQADRAEKRSLASMKFNMADAQRKERMGMARSAMDAAKQAQKDKLDAHKAHMQSLSFRAQAAARGAQAAKPTGQKGPSEAKLNEQLGAAEIAYAQNPTPENKTRVEALRLAVDRVKTSDFGPDRIAAMMAGFAGQRSDAQLRADVAREAQERLVADKVLEARTRAQYSPAYLAAKTDAAREAVLKKAGDDARALYGSTSTRPSAADTFDAQWAKLKKGESLVGPDGKTYIKQ